MIRYHSTRGDRTLFTFSGALESGIARDGGLFVPERIPELRSGFLKKMLGLSYRELAVEIFGLFETGISKEEVKNIVKKAYLVNFDSNKITPVIHLKDNQYILELWHGPTASFKDLALQIKPLFFSRGVKKGRNFLILTATSGDTGKAALEGYKNIKNIKIIVFYPLGKVSDLQELSMVTAKGGNLSVVAVKGDFDDCQRIVKEIFGDSGFNAKLMNEFAICLSSANSINWGRLLPQIIYHIYGYLQLVAIKRIGLGALVDIAVPTGNAGNILAAFYAKKMGLPVRKLICATNANDSVVLFLQTGVFDAIRKMVKTPSPAMDIILASNIERLIYEFTGNSQKVNQWMDELKNIGKFRVDWNTKDKLNGLFFSGSADNLQTLETVKKILDETGNLLDPHTAVVQTVVERYNKIYGNDIPVIMAATAHWSKFPQAVYRALKGKNSSSTSEFTVLSDIQKMVKNQKIHKLIRGLKKEKVRFKTAIGPSKNQAEKLIVNFLNDEKNSSGNR